MNLNQADEPINLEWLRASYHFHSYAYRDPRSVFASGIGLPVVSPTTVLLGIVSTLFSIGMDQEASAFLAIAHICDVIVAAPDGMIFFRAFHQIRRYETMKYGVLFLVLKRHEVPILLFGIQSEQQ